MLTSLILFAFKHHKAGELVKIQLILNCWSFKLYLTIHMIDVLTIEYPAPELTAVFALSYDCDITTRFYIRSERCKQNIVIAKFLTGKTKLQNGPIVRY